MSKVKQINKKLKANKELELKTNSSKVKCYVDNYYVESIIIDSKPKFLAFNTINKKIEILDQIETEQKIFKPISEEECGYRPYRYTSNEISSLIKNPPTKEELLDDIKKQIDKFLVVRELDKHLIQIDILLTHCLEWVNTIHYPFATGDTESGKSTILHLASWLCYRCHLGEDIPIADIYNFLGIDEEGCGTIAEDEAQALDPKSEKMRMYKSSYSKGSRKARILGTDSPKKRQVFYQTFCQKWFAGEKIPYDKGFQERLAVIHMLIGTPQSNIKRPSNDEVHDLNQLRNKILLWKVQNITKVLDHVDSGLKNRDRELWEDFLTVSSGTNYWNKAKEVVTNYVEERHSTIKNSFEARIFKLIVTKLNEEFEINALDLWNYLTEDNPELLGRLDQRTTKSFYPDEFGIKLTQNSLSKLLEYTFHAKKIIRHEKIDASYHKHTIYQFTLELVCSFVEKYDIKLDEHIPLYGCLSGKGSIDPSLTT